MIYPIQHYTCIQSSSKNARVYFPDSLACLGSKVGPIDRTALSRKANIGKYRTYECAVYLEGSVYKLVRNKKIRKKGYKTWSDWHLKKPTLTFRTAIRNIFTLGKNMSLIFESRGRRDRGMRKCDGIHFEFLNHCTNWALPRDELTSTSASVLGKFPRECNHFGCLRRLPFPGKIPHRHLILSEAERAESNRPFFRQTRRRYRK